MHSRWLRLAGVGLLALVLAIPLGEVQAQGLGPAVITGQVLDDREEPAAGLVVSVPELNLGAQTGADGRYTIMVPGERVRGQVVTVSVRGIGFRPQTQELTLTTGTFEVNFTMTLDVFLLEAVVVTGVTAGTEAIMVPFKVERIDAASLPVPAANALTQLQGKVPGANIVGHSGRPGEAPSIILRGPKSINAQGRSQEPLYIVDGVIIRGNLPDINPLDIESVEVVKGAAASSLYGAEAGNGVIQITTRSGRGAAEGVRIHVRTEAGINDVERDFGIARYHTLMRDETGRRFCVRVSGQPVCARTFDYNEARDAINNTPGLYLPSSPSLPVDPGSTSPGAAILTQRYQIEQWPLTTYNGVKQGIKRNPFQQYSIDAQGRVGGTAFFASASYLDQPGAMQFLEGFNRASMRLNLDQEIGTTIQVGVRTYYSHSVQDGEDQEGGSGNSFFYLTRAPAAADLLARDTLDRLYVRTNLQTGGLQNYNPLYQNENRSQKEYVDRFLGGTEIKFTPFRWLEASGNFNFDISRSSTDYFRDKGTRDTYNRASVWGGYIDQWLNNNEAFNTSLNLTMYHRFGDLRLRPHLRYAYFETNTKYRELYGGYLAVQGIKAASNITSGASQSSSVTSTRQISWAGGLNLEFKERYVLDGVLRRDGSSRFGAANRWDNYGRASVIWRVAEEPWWFIGPVTEFKLHGSYGTAGNIPSFAAQYETFNIGTGGVVSFGRLGNRDLRPEKMTEVEVGADIEIGSRLLFSVIYAQSETKDQILPVKVPAATGFGEQWQNVGTLQNKTWELSLNLPVIRSRDVSWTLKAIYDRTRTYVTELLVPPFNYGAPVQAAGEIFRLEGPDSITGVAPRYGTMYGRAFLKSCDELPNWTTDFRAQCGPGRAFQVNSDGLVVYVGDGNSLGDGITKNLWGTRLESADAPYGDPLYWGMGIILRDTVGGPASIVEVGNSLPEFRMAFTTDFTWKRLTLYALMDVAIGQDVWNQGFHWAHLDFLSKDVDQVGKSVEDAKPMGYYYRAGPPFSSGVGGLYDVLAPDNYHIEDASYAKLRELMVSYHLGSLGGVGDWSLSLVGRNVLTITGYRGFDPEVGIQGGDAGSAAINAADAFTFPNLRAFTFGVSTTF